MSAVLVIGVDPGPVPGIVGLHLRYGRIYDVDVAQVNADLAPKVLRMLVELRRPYGDVLVGVERFVVGRRAGRSSTPKAGAITRDMVGIVVQLGADLDVPVVQNHASRVKTWATDDRLERAGIDIPKGMRHARDAARHALFTAVAHGPLPDPMSRTHTRKATP